MSTAAVKLWGTRIGAITWDAERDLAFFEYDEAFRDSGIQVAPLTMPLAPSIYSFPELPRSTFRGLPGLLADSLPDRFGTAVVDAWLVAQGRRPGSLDPVERLCTIGRRGMGALEYEPARGPINRRSEPLSLDGLIALANQILAERQNLSASLADEERAAAMADILRVGTSAGGARAKAVIAWNAQTGEVRSGQVAAPPGFSHWLLKFDGVTGNRDKELLDPLGYGLIEYAYYLMAKAASVRMSECRLLAEGGRQHFMTRRFDRGSAGEKLHMQSLCGIAHFDFNMAGAYGYEQAFLVLQRLGLSMGDKEEQLRRMLFNIVARNQDDHVKNIAFMMDRRGQWSLSPAYDLTYAFNPQGSWTGQHQMSLQGKRDHFSVADVIACAKVASMKRGRAEALLSEVQDAVRRWPDFAAEAGVAPEQADAIGLTHRLKIAEDGQLLAAMEA